MIINFINSNKENNKDIRMYEEDTEDEEWIFEDFNEFRTYVLENISIWDMISYIDEENWFEYKVVRIKKWFIISTIKKEENIATIFVKEEDF